ncbi:MAG: PilZ domain-containing protein [Planctomycetota bacterium]
MSIESREGLIVRRDARTDVRLRGVVTVPREHEDIVKLSPSAPTGSSGVDAILIDIGKGGIGFESPIFFPRGAVIDVSLTDPDGNGSLLSERVIVRRTSMVGSGPTYATGVQFVDPSDHTERAIETLTAGDAS